MMKDPENMRKVKEMMADPNFQAQAKAAMNSMMGDKGMPDIAKLMQDPAIMEKAKNVAAAMGMGGAGGAGAGMDPMSELARLRAENAALKQRMA